jgi:hypothetical protein
MEVLASKTDPQARKEDTYDFATVAGKAKSSIGVSCGRVMESSQTASGSLTSKREEWRMAMIRWEAICSTHQQVLQLLMLPGTGECRIKPEYRNLMH